MGILSCAFPSASDVNATSGSAAQVSVRFESVANTTNELTRPLQLVHGYPSQYQSQPQQRLRNQQRSKTAAGVSETAGGFSDDMTEINNALTPWEDPGEADYSPAQCSLNLLVLALPVLAAAILLQGPLGCF